MSILEELLPISGYSPNDLDALIDAFEEHMPLRSETDQLAIEHLVGKLDLPADQRKLYMTAVAGSWRFEYCNTCGDNAVERNRGRFADCEDCQDDEPEPQFDTRAEHRGER